MLGGLVEQMTSMVDGLETNASAAGIDDPVIVFGGSGRFSQQRELLLTFDWSVMTMLSARMLSARMLSARMLSARVNVGRITARAVAAVAALVHVMSLLASCVAIIVRV